MVLNCSRGWQLLKIAMPWGQLEKKASGGTSLQKIIGVTGRAGGWKSTGGAWVDKVGGGHA
jgi:hypothetical protein